MGSCVSSNATGSSVPAAIAKLILMDGSIQEVAEEVRSQEILRENPGHFICNSDGLYVGQNIFHVLGADDQLQIGQLYFLLPQRKLQFVLTHSDMASLLFKINNAWVSAQKKKRPSRILSCGFSKVEAQVQPFFDIHCPHECGQEYHSSSVCCKSRHSTIPISMDRGRLQCQAKLETILETL